MYILEIIPIASLPPQVPQLLSYYHIKSLPKGSIVEVLIGNRRVPAVVTSSYPLEEQKASLKKSNFQLKKISSILSEEPLVSDIQFKIALWLSKNYFSPLGLCIKTVLPSFFLKKNVEIKKLDENNLELEKPIIMLSRAKDIIKNIESEIKKTISHKKSVLIILPEISSIDYFYNLYVDHYKTIIINSKILPKKSYENWEKISSGDVDIVIGTRQALFYPFSNIDLIIVEDPLSDAYKSDMSPKYSSINLTLKIAELYSCRILFVSQFQGVKNSLLIKDGEYRLEDNIKSPDVKIKMIDMVQEVRSGQYSVVGRDLTIKLKEYIEKRKKILIFSSRKGYSAFLICDNCGYKPKCPNCSIPFRLQGLTDASLICYRCSATEKIPDSCPNCHSSKFKAKGLPGSQRIEEEIKAIIENMVEKPDIFTLDSGIIKTDKAERELLNKMKDSQSYICIATQMIFSHRYIQTFDLIGIPNVDGLITKPDFGLEEELLYQFEKLIDFQPKEIIIQTYNPENNIFNLLSDHKLKEFYENDLQLRKLFGYPPFTRLIKLSFSHKDKSRASYESRLLGEKLKMAINQMKLDQSIKLLGPSPSFVERERGFYIYNIILKISPQLRLDDILKFVPSHWMIDVDPKSIL